MNRRISVLVPLTVLLLISSVIGCQRQPGSLRFDERKPPAETEGPSELDRLREQVVRQLLEALNDPAIQSALRAANAKEPQLTVAELIEIEELWRKADEDSELVSSLVESSCSQVLIDLQQVTSEIAEIFVTDLRGVNVCQTNKTSTYYQGNEAWWRKAMESRLPTHGQVEFDHSADAVAAPVYVPARDIQSGQVIGLTKAAIRPPSSGE